MNKLNVIIIDDELHGRENLKKIIETYCPEIEIKGMAASVVNAVELVNTHKPELVFLDINMPVLDGFDFLDEFTERNFMVVFVTAHEEFGIKAVKAGAADYIIKPVNIKELKQTVKKLLSLRKNMIKGSTAVKDDKIIIPASHGFDVIAADDIVRLEAEGCYTKIVFKDGRNKIASRTLKEFEISVQKEKFFRIHKSHLINLNYIKSYSSAGGYFVTMIDGSRIVISRRRAPEFTRKIKTALKAV
ncbi:MAG: LytTR family DNA-binding domain-containing protein [Bacteroidota bacterium]